jgi:hypothetical protein
MEAQTPLADRISIEEAAHMLAAAIAFHEGDEWLGPITRRQERMLEHWVDPQIGNVPPAIMPAMISFPSTAGGQKWARSSPSDPALRVEVEQAMYQRDLYEKQHKDALAWLEHQGFDTDAEWICRAALAQKMAEDDLRAEMKLLLPHTDETRQAANRGEDDGPVHMEVERYAGVVNGPSPRPKKKGHGRVEWNWPLIDLHIVDLLKKKGDPTDPNNMCVGWRSQNDLIAAIQEHCINNPDLYVGKKQAAKRPEEPSPTAVKSHLNLNLERLKFIADRGGP